MATHVINKIAGRIIPFLALVFWDKTTVVCAGAMPYRGDLPGHYQDLSLTRHDSAVCNLLLSVARDGP